MSHIGYIDSGILKKTRAKNAVIKKAKEKYFLYLKFFNLNNTHVTRRASTSNTGFITFDQRGVLAANNTFPPINPTINTKASGQFVINPVIAQSHLTFCKAARISSILKPTKNISTIIHIAHIIELHITQPRKSADSKKKAIVIIHIIISSFPTDDFKISFIFLYYYL